MGRPIVVVGSLNLDLVVRTERAPAAGETVLAERLERIPGGKGGNQAVGAARLGSRVAMIGRVGDDPFGLPLLQSLQADGIDTIAVTRSQSAGTGTAHITVEATGQNRIIVVPGANGEVTPSLVEQYAPLIQSAAVLLLQLEIPLDSVLRAAVIAAEAGLPVILDPAPAPAGPLPARLRDLATLVTPNETEATAMTAIPVEGRRGVEEAAQALVAQGYRQVLIKAGAAGAYLYAGGQGQWFDPFPVEAVDTTAAGDAFAGGLAAALERGYDLPTAIRWGSAAGAIAVTRPGAQPSIATHAELMALLETRREHP